MKFPLFSFMSKSLVARTMVFLMCVAAMAISISAQKTFDKTFSPEAVGVNIEQCANGPLATPVPCNTSGANEGYTRGNLVASKSHYLEGQSVPIRIVGDGLTIGTSYSVTIGYDYTKGGKYATDYLTDYDRTESVNNNPCVDVVGCTLVPESTFPIPIDPDVTEGFDQILGTSDDIVQIPGSFSCFGCTITGVSGYSLDGLTTGDSSKSITVTLTANQTSAVLSYGSHISTRRDWGLLNSAINISGSPYHNFILNFPGSNNGNRDLQLSADAVIFPAFITIEKTIVNFFLQTSGGTSFGFTSSTALFPGTTFSLVDNVAEPFSPTLTDRRGGTIDSLGIVSFGSGNLITVTENTPPSGWSLAGITCINVGGTANNTIDEPSRSVSIQLEEGELVKCSFHNTQLQPSAAPATISGRAVDSFGTGIGGARITVTDAQTGEVQSAVTNAFGYYNVIAEVGNFYVISISHRRYTFADNTRTLSLNDNIAGVDFVANP